MTTVWDNNEMSVMLKQCNDVFDLNNLNLNITMNEDGVGNQTMIKKVKDQTSEWMNKNFV